MEVLHRDLIDQLKKFINRKEIIVISGPRQAGKTTLMKSIGGSLSGNKKFINFEDAEIRKAFEESPLVFVKRFAGDGRLTLFLDEVQKIDKGGEKLKLIFDEIKGVKIFASGSSSLEMRTNVLHALAGRALIFELFTFSFIEFLYSRDKGISKLFKERNEALKGFIASSTAILEPAFTNEFMAYWKEYVVFGGYPEVVKEQKDIEIKKKLLNDIFNLYIDKDVVSFFRIYNSNKFIDFSKAVAFNIGGMLMLSSLANDIHITHYKAEKFLYALLNTYVVAIVYPYYKNLLTEIRKTPKLYFLDMGLRNSVVGNLLEFDNRDDRGKLAENFVFRELLTMGYKVKYWRTTGDAEMDFVIETNDGIVPIEVKLGGSKALGRSFYSFIEAYKPKRALVVTLDEFSKREINGTVVYSIPIFYL